MDTSYLAQQVTTIIGQLHGLFDEIGVPSHERDSREAEVRTRIQCKVTRLTPIAALLRAVRHATHAAEAGHDRET
jgi:hypothetical protein